MAYKYSPANAKLSAFMQKMNETKKSPVRQNELVQATDIPSRHIPEATKEIKQNISEGYKVESVTKKPGSISTVMDYKPRMTSNTVIDDTPETTKGTIENKGKPRKQKVIKSKTKSVYLNKGKQKSLKKQNKVKKKYKNVVTSTRRRF